MGSRKTTRKERERFAYEVSRRDFLKYCLAASSGALFLDPIRVLMGALVDGLIQKAQAQTTGLQVKKLLSLVVDGGPPRWVFDLPVQAKSGDPAPGNPLVVTKVEGGNRVYRTVPMGDYNFPALWGTGLPMSGGAMTASMAPLAQNALIIRGIRSINSHQAARVMVTRPDLSAPSLNGLVADHSHASVPAVNLAAMQTFKSHSGVGEFRTVLTSSADGANNPLFRTLSPFVEAREANFFTRRQMLDAFVKDAMSALRAHHEAGTPGVGALYDNADKAERQILEGVGDLTAAYGELFDKYTNIIDRVATASDWNSKMGFTLAGLPFMDDAQKITNLASVFAITEYLFKNGYSSTIHAAIGNMPGISNDAHNENADTHLRAFSFYFRAVAACIHELSRSLPDWDNTVVQVGSEFTRTPRVSETGSDHGWEGTVTSIFSGAIQQGPYLAGNIQRETLASYAGVWGKAAHVNIDRAEKTLGMGNLASAMAQILGVQSPTSNFASPIFLSGSGIISNVIGPPRLIT